MKKAIAKYIGYPLLVKVKGTDFMKWLPLLRESQYWDEERIGNYQINKLRNLIDYAKINVPYYEDLFNRIKLSSKDINSLEDINKIPILTKQMLRENEKLLISREFKKFKAKKSKTGGTTGVPVVVYKDANNKSFTWSSYYRWYEWMGIRHYDSVVTFWGAGTVLKPSIKDRVLSKTQQFIHNNYEINAFDMSDESMTSIVETIQKRKPLLLKGYLSAIIHLAEFVEKNKIKFNTIKAISTTTETLLPHNRDYIERVFGVPVFDQYGCGEVSAIAYECSAHEGLHINREHVICEVLDRENNPIFNGTGRVIATDLDNYVMPFIRYENGDMATLSDKKCSCGVNHPLMISIDGRSIDTVILKDGRRVHGVFFTDILYELNILTDKIQRFQIYQEIPGEIEFRVQRKDRLAETTKQTIIKAFGNFLNNVTIVEMERLPLNKGGKFSYIVNNVSG